MNILVTGARGFAGRNLVANLGSIRDGKDKTRPWLHIEEIYEYDLDTEEGLLEKFCQNCHFVFHLAGVNRPKEKTDFFEGNLGFLEKLLNLLKKNKNTCPVMLSSSIQASLVGRFEGSEYGKSKLASEKLLFRYGREYGAKVLVYRLPNLFGKWCRPNYNSVVATFCSGAAREESYIVNDRSTELELVYIDDFVNEMFHALEGKEHRCGYNGLTQVLEKNGEFCFVPGARRVTLGEIADLLHTFRTVPGKLFIPELPSDSFAKKLYSTYLSYFPVEKMSNGLVTSRDERGSFTELLKTLNFGQVSVNIVKPGAVKGQHWHNSKWEIFIVVSGHGLIQERKMGIDPETGAEYPVIEFEVSGDEITAVYMLPGYTHNIVNLSATEKLVTIIWANEQFDHKHPDTFYEEVGKVYE